PSLSFSLPWMGSGEGGLEEALLLELVARLRAGRRGGVLGARDAGERQAVADEAGQAGVEEVPGAHVEGLVLHPDERGAVLVGREGFGELVRERVELLETDDGDVVASELLPHRRE